MVLIRNLLVVPCAGEPLGRLSSGGTDPRNLQPAFEGRQSAGGVAPAAQPSPRAALQPTTIPTAPAVRQSSGGYRVVGTALPQPAANAPAAPSAPMPVAQAPASRNATESASDSRASTPEGASYPVLVVDDRKPSLLPEDEEFEELQGMGFGRGMSFMRPTLPTAATRSGGRPAAGPMPAGGHARQEEPGKAAARAAAQFDDADFDF